MPHTTNIPGFQLPLSWPERFRLPREQFTSCCETNRPIFFCLPRNQDRTSTFTSFVGKAKNSNSSKLYDVSPYRIVSSDLPVGSQYRYKSTDRNSTYPTGAQHHSLLKRSLVLRCFSGNFYLPGGRSSTYARNVPTKEKTYHYPLS